MGINISRTSHQQLVSASVVLWIERSPFTVQFASAHGSARCRRRSGHHGAQSGHQLWYSPPKHIIVQDAVGEVGITIDWIDHAPKERRLKIVRTVLLLGSVTVFLNWILRFTLILTPTLLTTTTIGNGPTLLRPVSTRVPKTLVVLKSMSPGGLVGGLFVAVVVAMAKSEKSPKALTRAVTVYGTVRKSTW